MVLAGLFLMVVQINRQSGAVLAIHFQEVMGLTATQIGFVGGAMYLGATIAQIPTGILFDRLGARQTLAGLGAIALFGLAIFALSEAPTGLALGRLLVGIGHAGVITSIYMLAIALGAAGTHGLDLVDGNRTGRRRRRRVGDHPPRHRPCRLWLGGDFLGLALVTTVATLAIWFLVRDQPAGRRRPPPAAAKRAKAWPGCGRSSATASFNGWSSWGSCFSAPFTAIGGLWAGLFDRGL